MKTNPRHSVLMICVALLSILIAHPCSLSAQATQPATQTIFARLIHAIRAKDRDEFLINSTDQLKQEVTPEVMEKMNQDLAAHLDSGYEATYFGELKQHGVRIRLWRLSFKDGSDDALMNIVLDDDGRVTGFFRR